MSKPLALIIEDDPQLSQIFSISLGGHFLTEVIMDGATALARLAECEPSVVVLDLHLPEVTGETILAYIRAEDRLAQTRVILATADARNAEFLSSDADIVLLKPVNPISLRDLAARIAQTQDV